MAFHTFVISHDYDRDHLAHTLSLRVILYGSSIAKKFFFGVRHPGECLLYKQTFTEGNFFGKFRKHIKLQTSVLVTKRTLRARIGFRIFTFRYILINSLHVSS